MFFFVSFEQCNPIVYFAQSMESLFSRVFFVCEFRNCHTTSQLRETPRDSLSDYDRAYVPRGPATDGRTDDEEEEGVLRRERRKKTEAREKRRRSRPRKRNGEERRLNLTGVKLTLVGSPCIQYGDFLIESG